MEATIKYKGNIAQNHRRNSGWADVDVDKLWGDASYVPQRTYGPVQLAQIAGKGRGIVAQEDIPMAETVMVLKPLGPALLAPLGRELHPEHLAHALAQAPIAPADRARLRALSSAGATTSAGAGAATEDGASAPGGAVAAVPPALALPRSLTLQDLSRIEDKLKRPAGQQQKAKGRGFGSAAVGGPAAGAGAGPAGGAAAALAALGEAEMEAAELLAILRGCAFGDTTDAGAAVLRGEPQQEALALWPELALVNHSCAANTAWSIVGDVCVGVAAADIPTGAEVETSYLWGGMALQPLDRRRQVLGAAYGFTCRCARCTAEESAPLAVRLAASAAHEATVGGVEGGDGSASVLEQIGSAIAGSNEAACSALEAEVQQAVDRVEGALAEHGLEDKVQAWMRASAYQAYYGLALLMDRPGRSGGLGGQKPGLGALFGKPAAAAVTASDPEVPQRLARIVGSVAPGSDMELQLWLEGLIRTAEAYGKQDERTAEVTKACLRAHLMRYGRVSDSVLGRIVLERSQRTYYLGRSVDVGGGVLGGSAPSGPEPALLRQMAAKVSGEGMAAPV